MPLHCVAITPKFMNAQYFFQTLWPVLMRFLGIKTTIFNVFLFCLLLCTLVSTSPLWYWNCWDLVNVYSLHCHNMNPNLAGWWIVRFCLWFYILPVYLAPAKHIHEYLSSRRPFQRAQKQPHSLAVWLRFVTHRDLHSCLTIWFLV